MGKSDVIITAQMSSLFIRDVLIPLAEGYAVTPGWPEETGGRPHGVTWHWTATWDLAECRQLLGGPNAQRRGIASAHYAVGRSREEGIDRYVLLEDRSWHAGKNQLLRWDGRPYERPEDKGARTTIGVETVNIGFAREDVSADGDWIEADTPGGARLLVQPWPEEQVAMMIALGRLIVERWPNIGPRDHHGHHDLCPDYKSDVTGFPFARVLRGIYPDQDVPDVWSGLWTARQRQAALVRLGYLDEPVDDIWGPDSRAALRRFQVAEGLHPDERWTTFVSWRVTELLGEAPSPEEDGAGDSEDVPASP